MDLSSRTAQLCIAGTQAEFERRIEDARRLFGEAWDAATNDYEAAMAAHYVGHLESDPEAALEWHLTALSRAEKDERAVELMGSLLVCVGGAYEALGRHAEAAPFFEMAAAQGVIHKRD